MAVTDLHLISAAPRSAVLRRYRLGGPVLSARRARSIRRYAVANVVLLLLAGWLSSRGTYNAALGWLAIGGYLSVTAAVQVLTVLPTVRRVDLT